MDGAAKSVAADHSQRPHQKQNKENCEHKTDLSQLDAKAVVGVVFSSTPASCVHG